MNPIEIGIVGIIEYLLLQCVVLLFAFKCEYA